MIVDKRSSKVKDLSSWYIKMKNVNEIKIVLRNNIYCVTKWICLGGITDGREIQTSSIVEIINNKLIKTNNSIYFLNEPYKILKFELPKDIIGLFTGGFMEDWKETVIHALLLNFKDNIRIYNTNTTTDHHNNDIGNNNLNTSLITEDDNVNFCHKKFVVSRRKRAPLKSIREAYMTETNNSSYKRKKLLSQYQLVKELRNNELKKQDELKKNDSLIEVTLQTLEKTKHQLDTLSKVPIEVLIQKDKPIELNQNKTIFNVDNTDHYNQNNAISTSKDTMLQTTIQDTIYKADEKSIISNNDNPVFQNDSNMLDNSIYSNPYNILSTKKQLKVKRRKIKKLFYKKIPNSFKKK